jgi:hypothetical protein
MSGATAPNETDLDTVRRSLRFVIYAFKRQLDILENKETYPNHIPSIRNQMSLMCFLLDQMSAKVKALIGELDEQCGEKTEKLTGEFDITEAQLMRDYHNVICHLAERVNSISETSTPNLSNLARENANNEDRTKQPMTAPMPTAPANTDDALWAMRAWGERYDHSEFREHLGKFVAVYEFRVILSGDDPDDVLRRAAELCHVPESRITVDYWDE